MKAKPLICAMALLAATVSGRSLADNTETWEVDLDFPSTTLQNVSFTETAQDVGGFEGITSSIGSDGNAMITVEGSDGGNILSFDTGDWFQDQVGTGAAIGCKSSSDDPSGLYFAFTGNLAVTMNGGNELQCNDISMGMGSVDIVHNNWWIGGPGMKSTEGGLQQSCTYNGSAKTVTFSTPSGCVNTFSISVSD